MIGQTKQIDNDTNPAWRESFTIPLPLCMTTEECKLVVTALEIGKPVGSLIFEGPALFALFAKDGQQDVYMLENEQKIHGKMKKLQCGEIKLGGSSLNNNSNVLTSSSAEKSEVPPNEVNSDIVALDGDTEFVKNDLTSLLVPTSSPTTAIAGTEDIIENIEEIEANLLKEKKRNDAFQDLHNMYPDEYILSITKLKGLINTEALKNR